MYPLNKASNDALEGPHFSKNEKCSNDQVKTEGNADNMFVDINMVIVIKWIPNVRLLLRNTTEKS